MDTSYRCGVLSESLEYNLGSLVMEALRDPTVIEIMLNPDGKLWVERLGQSMQCVGRIEPEQGYLIVTLMGSALKTTATAQNPIIEGELPLDGSRFEGLIPPVVSNPSFAIRKKAAAVFSIEQYIAEGILPAKLTAGLCAKSKYVETTFEINNNINSQEYLINAVTAKQNILVVGSTGSGKTTLVNAILKTLSGAASQERLIIIEDTLELQCTSENVVFLRTSDFVDIRRLVRASMRLRPDRIVIGEVRDGAALDLLKGWNTGHPGGLATVHANSAYEGLLRLEELIEEATTAPKHRLIAAAVNLVIFIEKYGGSRRVSEIAAVKGYDNLTKEYELKYLLAK